MAFLQELRKLSLYLQDKLVSFALYASRAAYADGKLAQNSFYMSGDIIADETVTIGSNVFQCKAITTDSGATATLANVAAGVASLLTLNQASGTPATCVVGDLLRLENEIVKIIAVITTSTVFSVARGRCGTTRAAHAAVSVFQASAVSATNVPVGVNVTLTPTVFIAALVAEINNALANGQRPTSKASTIFDPGATFDDGVSRPDAARAGKVIARAPAVDTLLITSAIAENSVLATTESVTNGAFQQGATMIGGVAVANKPSQSFARVPTAAEVTKGQMLFKLTFTPSIYLVTVLVTASGLNKVWVGAVTLVADTSGAGCTIVVDNTGGTDWAATDTVMLFAE